MCHLASVLAVVMVLKVVVENRLNIEKIQHLRTRDKNDDDDNNIRVTWPLLFLK